MAKKVVVSIVALVLCFSCLFALAACSDNGGETYVYTGTATTNYHDTDITIKVKVSVKDDKISKIEIVDDKDAGSIDMYTKKWNEGKSAVLAFMAGKTVTEINGLKTSYDVGANSLDSGYIVASATVTSNLFVKAVQNALNGVIEGGNGSSGNETEEKDLFREQLEKAGITAPAYADPNAPIFEKEVVSGSPDVITGASGAGSDYYAGTGSYQTYEYMYKRFAMKYYYSVVWTNNDTAAAGTFATTLTEAAALPNAKYIKAEFPNDGKKYVITMNGNALASKAISTADENGELTVAVLGMGVKTLTNGEMRLSSSVVTKQTILNFLNNDKGVVMVYEYDFTSGDKMGAGTRNFGCRLVVEIDRENSMFVDKDRKPMQAVGNSKTMIEGATSVSLVLKVTAMWTVG